MIKSLRRKFVLISTVSVCLVFSGIFFFLLFSTRMQTDRTLDTLADTIADNDGVFPEFDPAEHRLPMRLPYADVINEETQFSTRFFVAWMDAEGNITRVNMDSVSAMTRQQIETYVQQAGKKAAQRGWMEDYRYKIVRTDKGVIIVSKWAVRPVAESYEKQRQFITDANHELKTPLTLILSNLDIVEAEVGKNEWLDDIRSEGERMGLLINQLVTLSRMDEGTASLVYEDFDLSDAVADTVSEFQGLAEERGHRLTSRITPAMEYHGDESMIRRLTAILLDNAVKYCDPEGEIRLSLTKRRYPVLVVENTYRDVDELELGRLFDRFYRADKARTFSGSFGVGLSIAQSIVKSHKGNISAYKKKETIGFRVELK